MTILDILQFKKEGKKISALTAYDYSFARILDKAGIDIIMVGDSLGNVVLGYENTLPVTMDEMIHHTRAVSRGVKNALLVGDMPFGSYQESVSQCLANGTRFLKEAGAGAVKLEGGTGVEGQIRVLAESGVPVMGHVGLTPQSVHRFGGYRIQGRGRQATETVLEDARAVERAGAFSIVLEGIPSELAKRITGELSIPTIGIGAGPHCDGQILVSYDLLGITRDFHPKFVRTYANLGEEAGKAVKRFVRDVQKGRFPSMKESFK